MDGKKQILFIEDDHSTMEVYQIAFEQAGFEVIPIFSGEDALEVIKEIVQNKTKKPDLILLDYVLSGVDGFEVLREIRKNPKTKNLKVLLTTNYSVAELKLKGKFIDGEKFVLKADYPPSKLIELVKKDLGVDI